MGESGIEYVDRTVNPIRAILLNKPTDMTARGVGHYCEKVSGGCKFCYSDARQPRFGLPTFDKQRLGKNVEVYFDPAALNECRRRRIPTRWFPFDMTDAWGWWVHDEWLDYVFAVAVDTPQHTYLWPTKRPDRMRRYMSDPDTPARVAAWLKGNFLKPIPMPRQRIHAWPPENVHLGVSVEDQATAEERVPLLLKTSAAVRWVSYEPALAPVDWGCWLPDGLPYRDQPGVLGRALDWVVIGGESGRGARPFDLAWARAMIMQCRTAGLPVFVKQLGARPIYYDGGRNPICELRLRDRKGGDVQEWPSDLRVREFPDAG